MAFADDIHNGYKDLPGKLPTVSVRVSERWASECVTEGVSARVNGVGGVSD